MEDVEIKRPREAANLEGHEKVLKKFAQSLKANKLHHAWLIAGQRGIGKATLTYKLVRFILSGGVEKGATQNLFGEAEINFDLEEGHPVFSQIANNSHPDLLVVDSMELGRDSAEIGVDDIRKVNHFVRMTSAGSGWKVVIIDAADDMNRNAANAILKILEEPTEKSIFFLIAHSPGRLLPTIKSRCNVLDMQPLDEPAIEKIIQRNIGDVSEEEANFAIKVSDGSPGIACDIIINNGMQIYKNILASFTGSNNLNMDKAMQIATKLSAKDADETWRIGNFLLGLLISRVTKYKFEEIEEIIEGEKEVLNRLAGRNIEDLLEIYKKHKEKIVETDIFNLDRKMVVLDMINQISFRAA